MLSCFLLSGVGAQILYPQSTIYQPTVYQTTTPIQTTYLSAPTATYQLSAPAATYQLSAPATAYQLSAPTTTYYAAPATSYIPGPLVPAPQPQQFLSARDQAVANTVQGLNYALSLENLESNFYRQVNGLLSSDTDFLRLAPRNGERFNLAILRTRFREIGSHEDGHVAALTALITRLCSLSPNVPNCAPVRACTYNFNINPLTKDVNAIVATAELLENTGVQAYAGAIASLIQDVPLSPDGTIDSGDIVEAAATITTVEARHTAFLSTIRGLDPFPQVTDTPVRPNEILCAARPFVVNAATCPVFNTANC